LQALRRVHRERAVKYTTAERTMNIAQFIETEVNERRNYTLEEVIRWIKKYHISSTSRLIWVSSNKAVAYKYGLLAKDWDRPLPVELTGVREIRDDEGFIIPESDDGDEGFLFVFRPSEPQGSFKYKCSVKDSMHGVEISRYTEKRLSGLPGEVVLASIIKAFMVANNIKSTINNVLITALKAGPNEALVDKFVEGKHHMESEDVSRLMELTLGTGESQHGGMFFTPANVSKMMAQILAPKDSKQMGWNTTFNDPTCGGGIMLVHAAEGLHEATGKRFIPIIEENIFGSDISFKCVLWTKVALSLLALKNGEDKQDIQFNIVQADVLRNPPRFEKAGPGKLKVTRRPGSLKDPYWKFLKKAREVGIGRGWHGDSPGHSRAKRQANA